MVCYARPAGRMAALLLVVFLVFGRSVGHFFDAAALMVAIAVAVGGAAVAAAVAVAAFGSIQRRRAAAGGCVGCQFRCQHAMTASPRRSWLVTTVDRRAPVPVAGRPAAAPGRPAPVFLPMPSVAPRWPDRPARRPVTSQPGPREREGSAA